MTTTSDTQYDKATAYTKVKSSGVLGAGLGIMVGTQKMQDNYEDESKTQIGTTLGSSEGSITIAAGDTAHLTTTDIIGKTGVAIAAQNIILDGKQNEAHEHQTHEESMSGLTIGLSSPVMEAAEGLRSTIRTAQTRDNKTLQALEVYEGGKTLNNQIHAMKQDEIGSVGIHVGIGSSSFKQEYQKDTVTYAGGALASEGTITLAVGSNDAAKGNIKAIGETIQGQNITLAASHDIDLRAATNTQTIAENYNSKGSSLGMTITGGAISGVDASFSKEKDEGTTTMTPHAGTTVTASDTLTMQSGNDMNITGSQVGGNTIKADIGGNLHITSLQDTEMYRGNNSSLGGGISRSLSSGSKKEWLPDSLRKYDSTPYVPGTTSSSAFWGKGRMDSDYASVTKQAGIYAGEGGFTVHVGDNTHLTGALLDSTAVTDKNSLTTGTLTMEDIGNKAEYDVKNIGVSYHHYDSESERNRHFNQSGLTPSISPGAQDESASVTESAIVPGTISTTKAQMDLSQINRNTADALHKLDQIFDKKEIKERQELAQLFSKNANELLHQYDRDGTFDKALAHGIVAEISSQIAGNGAGSGFAAGFTNELLINKLEEWSGGDPAKAQWISAALGATVNASIGKAIQIGSATAQYGMKWNNMFDNNITEGEFATLNDAIYAVDVNDQIELSKTSYNVYDETTKIWVENNLFDIADSSSLNLVNNENLGLAAQMFQHALHGSGEKQWFDIGTSAYNHLNSDPELISEIRNYGSQIPIGESQTFYFSIRTSGYNNLAFGKIKIAATITHNYDGTFSAKGQAKDVYNFEMLNYPELRMPSGMSLTEFANFGQGIAREGVVYINNIAAIFQAAGLLTPYIYGVRIDVTV